MTPTRKKRSPAWTARNWTAATSSSISPSRVKTDRKTRQAGRKTMTNSQSRTAFLKTEKARLLREELLAMVKSPEYNTRPIYSTVESEGSQFVEKHMNYMSDFRNMDHWQYVSNLKLKTKIRK